MGPVAGATADDDRVPSVDELMELTDTAATDDPPAEPEDDSPPAAAAEAATPDAETESSPAEAPADAAEPPEDTPDAETSAPPAGQPAADAPPTEPFRFRVDGREIDVPGAHVVDLGPDGGGRCIVIPADVWDRRIRPHVADRRAIHQRHQQELRELEQRLDPSRNETVIRATALAEVLDPVLEALSRGDVEPLKAFVAEYAGAGTDRLQLMVENRLLKARSEMQQQVERSRQQEAEAAALVPLAEEAVRQSVQQILETPVFEGLGLDAAELEEQAWALQKSGVPILFRAQEGDGSGLPPGQVGINRALLYERLMPLASVARRVAEARAAAQQARARNDAALAGATGRRSVPPAVPAAGSPGAGGKKTEPKTLAEWEESVLSGR